MKYYGVNELREMFLKFFESKGHLRMNSFSLVPHNDKSLLIINSGMAPLKPYFTGEEIPPRTRVTTCQKCIRTGDLENVGKTARHGTFFEMLGNFSFGDYFKKESIPWAWEFLTEWVGLDPDRLYPSVYEGDDEAYNIWLNDMHIPAERIYKFGKADNFWEHGSGPCGPCTEIYYDRGEKWGNGPEDVMGGEGDRYMEVWNVVFSQFNNDGHGNYTELEHKNIDTGMGLERLAVAVQDVASLFDVDTVRALRDEVWTDVSVRIITDHIRSATFMISDGIMASNEGRGYVLRRLIRRAIRQGRKLGIKDAFMTKLAEAVIEGSKGGYPELEEKKVFILKNLAIEEERFAKTIDQGLDILAGMMEKLRAEGAKQLSGDDAFLLYDTYGFPIDSTQDVLEENGFTVDTEGFEKARAEAREKSKGSWTRWTQPATLNSTAMTSLSRTARSSRWHSSMTLLTKSPMRSPRLLQTACARRSSPKRLLSMELWADRSAISARSYAERALSRSRRPSMWPVPRSRTSALSQAACSRWAMSSPSRLTLRTAAISAETTALRT